MQTTDSDNDKTHKKCNKTRGSTVALTRAGIFTSSIKVKNNIRYKSKMALFLAHEIQLTKIEKKNR